MSQCLTGLTDGETLYSTTPGIFCSGRRFLGMKIQDRFRPYLLASLIGVSLSTTLPVLAAEDLATPVLDRLEQQVEQRVSRQIERQLDAASERALAPSRAPDTLTQLPTRLPVQSSAGEEVFADVEVEDGWRAAEHQWLTTVDSKAVYHFQQPGITLVDRTPLEGLDLTLLRFRVSPALDSRERLRQVLPASLVDRLDRNHIYRPETHPDSTGQSPPTGPSSPPPNARSCNQPVRVGMVDTAIDTSHPAFIDIHIRQRDFLQELDLAEPFQPPTDHGTAVASRLAGRTSADGSPRLPGVTLISASVFFDRQAALSGATLKHLVEALAWLHQNEVALINVSMAGPDNRVLATVIRRLIDRGVAIVAAVGNEGPAAAPLFPAGYPGVIGVTAVDRDRAIYRWANRGAQVDFAATGVDVAVAGTGGGFDTESGTSLAAPVVSARLACALARAPLDTALNELRHEAEDLGAPGQDPVYGAGLLHTGP